MFGEMPLPCGPGARKFALVRHLEQRIPVARRIIFRRGFRVGRDHRRQIHRLARRESTFAESTSPYPRTQSL